MPCGLGMKGIRRGGWGASSSSLRHLLHHNVRQGWDNRGFNAFLLPGCSRCEAMERAEALVRFIELGRRAQELLLRLEMTLPVDAEDVASVAYDFSRLADEAYDPSEARIYEGRTLDEVIDATAEHFMGEFKRLARRNAEMDRRVRERHLNRYVRRAVVVMRAQATSRSCTRTRMTRTARSTRRRRRSTGRSRARARSRKPAEPDPPPLARQRSGFVLLLGGWR